MLSTDGMAEGTIRPSKGVTSLRHNPSPWSHPVPRLVTAFSGVSFSTHVQSGFRPRREEIHREKVPDCCQNSCKSSITNNGLESMPSHDNQVKLCRPIG